MASSGWRCDGQAFPVHSFWGRCRRAGRDGPRRLGGRWRWPVNDVWLLHLAPSILSEIYRAWADGVLDDQPTTQAEARASGYDCERCLAKLPGGTP